MEAKFGLPLPARAKVDLAEGEPVAAVTRQPQIRVVFNVPHRDDSSAWVGLVGSVRAVSPESSPELAEMGVSSIRGGSSGFTEVYIGELSGRTYISAYRRL